ncbi:DnaB-like helicase C-terminal domain-containing protein [Paenibacillus sp. FSL W8-0426]|uniref:replicative DNA helicase n=1 Tax=Paenibacillus sp. FSL W8-0426 TaxID=2921714 RepID=UPI0030DC2CDC
MSIEAERATLGMLLKQSSLMDECYLRPDDFGADSRHKTIMTTLQYAYEQFNDKPDPFDLVVMATHWGNDITKIGGITYLMQLRESAVGSNFEEYQRAVRAASIQRKAAETMATALNEGTVDVSAMKERMEQLEEEQGSGEENGMKKMSDTLGDHHKEVIKRSTRAGLTGAKAASKDYNDMSGGHQKQDVTIVAARPSIGKTAYIVNDATSVAMTGYTAAIFSAEMAAADVSERFICSIGGIDSKKIRNGLMSENDWASYSSARDIIDSLPLYIDDTPGMTIEYIWRETKRMKKQFPNLVIYIDYLQLIESEKKFNSTADRVNYVSKQLKKIARTFDVSVIAISSVGRKCEDRQDKRPMMSDLRESGNIEFDADVIIFLYRDDYYYPDTVLAGIIELIVAKGRKIGTGTIQMFFNRKNGRFTDLDTDQKYELQKQVRERERASYKK